MKFSRKIENLELRSCSNHLTLGGKHTTAEIVKWMGKTCFTLAYWNKTDNGYTLRFVADRPFFVDKDIFWQLAEIGQKRLDFEFNREL